MGRGHNEHKHEQSTYHRRLPYNLSTLIWLVTNAEWLPTLNSFLTFRYLPRNGRPFHLQIQLSFRRCWRQPSQSFQPFGKMEHFVPHTLSFSFVVDSRNACFHGKNPVTLNWCQRMNHEAKLYAHPNLWKYGKKKNYKVEVPYSVSGPNSDTGS